MTNKKERILEILIILIAWLIVSSFVKFESNNRKSDIEYAYYRGVWSGCAIAEQNNPNIESVCLDAQNYAKKNDWASWDALQGK